MGMGKNLNSYDFNVKFFQIYCDSLSNNIFVVFNYIFDTKSLSSDWDKIFFIFVPKKDNLKKINDFSLIALYNIFYKLFFKVLANRMCSYLNQHI